MAIRQLNQTALDSKYKRSLPASRRWRPCHPAATPGKWWWTWHLRLQGYAFVHAGLPGAELSQRAYDQSAGPRSVAGNSAWLRFNVAQPEKSDKRRMWISPHPYTNDLYWPGEMVTSTSDQLFQTKLFKSIICDVATQGVISYLDNVAKPDEEQNANHPLIVDKLQYYTRTV